MIDILRNIFFRDFWLKLFSLVLAVLIWLAVSSAIHRDVSPGAPLALPTGSELTITNVPVTVMSSAGDVRDYKVDPKTVEVTVRGDIAGLQALRVADFRAFVDMTGTNIVHTARRRVSVATPGNVTFVATTPTDVEVIAPSDPDAAIKNSTN